MTNSENKNQKRGIAWLCLGYLVFICICLALSGGQNQTPVPEETMPAETQAVQETAPQIPETTAPMVPTEPPVDKTSWNLLLVNPWNKIPEDYSVELADIGNGHQVDARACPDFQDMMEAMKAEGLRPVVCSSFRTNEKQQTLFQRKVSFYLDQGYTLDKADEEAGKWIAVPGTSEHETGLALDIVDKKYQILDEKQENTDTQKWLMANSWRYGFILRYPSDKSQITGIYYEPWHYRYVGKEAAKEIFEQGICLEEYLE